MSGEMIWQIVVNAAIAGAMYGAIKTDLANLSQRMSRLENWRDNHKDH